MWLKRRKRNKSTKRAGGRGGVDKILKRELSKAEGLGTVCQLWQLHMPGKASLPCERAKCGETASLENFY